MIDIFRGTINDLDQLNTEIWLTGADQVALSNAILHGAAVMRLQVGNKTGNPAAALVSIDCTWYDPFDGGSVGANWRVAQTLTLTGGLGSTSQVELAGPELTAKCLACFPTAIRFTWGTATLNADNCFDGCEYGIMLANAMR